MCQFTRIAMDRLNAWIFLWQNPSEAAIRISASDPRSCCCFRPSDLFWRDNISVLYFSVFEIKLFYNTKILPKDQNKQKLLLFPTLRSFLRERYLNDKI